MKQQENEKLFLNSELRLIYGCFLFLTVLALLHYIGFTSYIIGFFIGVVWCSLTLPFVVYYVYKMQLEDDLTDPNLEPIENSEFSTRVVKIGKGLAESLKDNEKTYEEIIEEDEKKKEVISGKFHLQMAGKTKSRKPCVAVLKGDTLFFQLQGHRRQCMILTGAYIRKKDDYNIEEKKKLKDFKFFVELSHPNHSLLYKIDNVYLIFDEAEPRDRWYFALLTVCTPFLDLYRHVKLPEGQARIHFRKLMEEFTQLKKWNITESGTFVDALFSRFFIHIQESFLIKRKIVEFLTVRLSETIEENGLQERFSNIVITSLSVGSKAPSLSNFTVVEPKDCNDANLDLRVHFMLSYKDGDASLGLQAKLAVLNTEVSVKATVTLKTLEGPMTFLCLPYPMAKMAFSFDMKPLMVLDVDVHIGGPKGVHYIPDTIKALLHKKFNDMVKEKFVIPNWKYIRIPGVKKNEPATLETKFKVRNLFSNVQGEDGDQTEEPIEDVPMESLNEESDEDVHEKGKEEKRKKKGTFAEKLGKIRYKKKLAELDAELVEEVTNAFKSCSAPPDHKNQHLNTDFLQRRTILNHPKTPK